MLTIGLAVSAGVSIVVTDVVFSGIESGGPA
jgi:hypothetical protein